MSTNSVTTAVGKVEGEINYVSVRNGLLNALTISSGAVDAVSFLALGKVFTAFMTGNFAFLGMGIAGNAGAPRIVSVLASLAGFAGGFAFLYALDLFVHRGASAGDKASQRDWVRSVRRRRRSRPCSSRTSRPRRPAPSPRRHAARPSC